MGTPNSKINNNFDFYQSSWDEIKYLGILRIQLIDINVFVDHR